MAGDAKVAIPHPLIALPAPRGPTVLCVKKGAKVVCEGRAATVLGFHSSSEILINYLGTSEKSWCSLEALSSYQESYTRAHAPDEAKAEDDFEFQRAREWTEQFNRFKGYDNLPPDITAEIGESLNASRRTVERHFALYQLDSSIRGQLPCKPGPEKGTSKLPPLQLAIIDQAIKERYRTKERGSVQATADLIGPRCTAAGIDVPCYNTVRARIQSLDQWQLARERHGRVRGDAKSGPAGGGILTATSTFKSLDFVQMDHAIVDVMVVDPKTREVIGRPWITLAIDVVTRCLLGFHLTFDAPSQTSVALALEHCCLPKDTWLKGLSITDPWLPFGLMKCIGWDNAKCFKNTNLINACRKYDIEPLPRKVRHPVHGAHIERVIGTYMGRIHLIKGTTFSNTQQREDYKSEEKAVMTLRELEVWTVHEILRYHSTKHDGLGCTPIEAWVEAWAEDGAIRLPPIPSDRRKFRLELLPRIMRTIGREGIQRFTLKYWDEGLIPFIGAKKKFWIAHDPRNISRVHVQIEDDWIDVPWRDQTRAPIALWEWECAKRELRKKHNAPASQAEAFRHIEAQREIEKNAEKTTRQQRRDRQRRPADDRPSPKPKISAVDYDATPTILVSPFEVRHV